MTCKGVSKPLKMKSFFEIFYINFNIFFKKKFKDFFKTFVKIFRGIFFQKLSSKQTNMVCAILLASFIKYIEIIFQNFKCYVNNHDNNMTKLWYYHRIPLVEKLGLGVLGFNILAKKKPFTTIFSKSFSYLFAHFLMFILKCFMSFLISTSPFLLQYIYLFVLNFFF